MADDYTPTTDEVREFWASRQTYEHDWTIDTARSIFDRWFAGMIAAKRAEWEAEQGEPEWEYRCTGPGGDTPRRFATESEVAWHMKSGCGEMQRRKAGPWLPVPDTTNHESESADPDAEIPRSDGVSR